MDNFYDVSIKYEKVMNDGKTKKVTEHYLCEAMSVTESESRIIEEMKPYISSDFYVKSSKISDINEVFVSSDIEDEYWFKCELYIMMLDEKSGVDKKSTTKILVQAADLRKAIDKLDEGMKGSTIDYTIKSVSESNILDYYRFEG